MMRNRMIQAAVTFGIAAAAVTAVAAPASATSRQNCGGNASFHLHNQGDVCFLGNGPIDVAVYDVYRSDAGGYGVNSMISNNEWNGTQNNWSFGPFQTIWTTQTQIEVLHFELNDAISAG